MSVIYLHTNLQDFCHLRPKPKMTYSITEDLPQLIEKLDKSYYEALLSLCDAAKKHALKLQELEVHLATSQYVALCNKLIDEVNHFVTFKKENFIPYLRSLVEKEQEKHDCTTCAGNCNVKHELQLLDLRQSHLQLKDIIYRVQMVALPLYSETIYPDVYRLLRNRMALIESTLTELFSVEETRLIPRISEAQKNINARG